MQFALLLYAGIGLTFAIVMLCATGPRRMIDRIACRSGMGAAYARTIWIGGTIAAWPVGLFVLISGRLVLVDDEAWKAAADRDESGGRPHAVGLKASKDEISPSILI